MSNDSSTGGYLAPSSAAPLDDDALDDFLQSLVVALTGLPGQMVRPRFQADEPALPDAGTNWAAIGVMPGRKADTFPFVLHDGSGNGADTLIRHETLDVLCSFYGPNAGGNATLLRDGLAISQNREALYTAQMGLVSVGDATRAPELLKNLWTNRWDLPFTVRRAITRTYPVLNLETAAVTVTDETAAGTITSTLNVA